MYYVKKYDTVHFNAATERGDEAIIFFFFFEGTHSKRIMQLRVQLKSLATRALLG